MEKSSIEMIKKMADSLEKLANAWYEIKCCWEDSEVIEIMARMCDFYPFDHDFDEMADEVDTWVYLSANELRKVSVIEEQWNKISIGKPIANTQFYILDKDMNCLDFRVQKCLINVNKK